MFILVQERGFEFMGKEAEQISEDQEEDQNVD